MHKPMQNNRVLIVDDDATICLLMSEALMQAGFDVKEAYNGEEGLAIFHDWQPNLIISDVKMPKMDGFEFCAAVRESVLGKTVPLMMATGLEDLESINRAYNAGATDFITKPFNYTILEHRIKYILRAYINSEALLENQERLAWAQKVARMGYWELNSRTLEITLSPEVFDMFQILPEQFDKQLDSFLSMIHEDDREDVRTKLYLTIEDDVPTNARHRVLLEHKVERVMNLQARRTEAEAGVRSDKIRGLIQDVTAQKQANDQIRYLKMYDALTGLPNKQLFVEYASKALSLAQRQKALVGMFCIDIDQFRRVNETLGPTVGDLVLKEVVSRFLDMIRESDIVCSTEEDSECATLARNSGNTFNILVMNVMNIQAFVVIANRIEERFFTPFEAEGHEIVMSASVGISVSPVDGDNVNSLLKNAETAMYHARRTCLGSHQFYSTSMNESSMQRFKMESRLRHAIENETLEVHYQPQFELNGTLLIGMEALIRWNDQELGRISPGDFIPMAEETGLIAGLTEFVLSKSCEQTQAWIQTLGIELRIGVNISSHSLQDPGFVAFVSQVLQDSGLPPQYLELEITEGSIMQQVDTTIELLDELRDLGLTLSIDDFGTGYSSFSYLHKFPVNTLKIDQSFIFNLDEGEGNKKIVNAIISLAHSLQLNVVAEGVETQTNLDYLLACGCDEVQGFFLSKPLPWKDFEQFAQAQRDAEKVKRIKAPS